MNFESVDRELNVLPEESKGSVPSDSITGPAEPSASVILGHQQSEVEVENAAGNDGQGSGYGVRQEEVEKFEDLTPAGMTEHGVVSLAVADKEGKDGEAGVGESRVGPDTAFATFSAFDGQSNADSHDGIASASVEPVQSKAVQFDSQHDDDVLTHKAVENPVVTAAKALGIYKTPLGSGMHEISCPWAHEHANPAEDSAIYAEPDEYQPSGSFHCKDANHAHLAAKDLLEGLGVPKMAARNKPTIRNVPGDLHAVVDAAERVLAKRGKYFQSGTVIVSVTTDTTTENPTIAPISALTLTRELSAAASWEREDSRSGSWKPCDPPARHVGILYNASEYRYLPVLSGVARQPYFSEVDGKLLTKPGYNEETKIFGVFDPARFPLAEPTMREALHALTTLMGLLSEFHFASLSDKSTMLSAIFTAVVRPSLPHAPGFHVRAHDIGSGKSYACEVISAIASPAPSEKVSYPTSSEEATKVILALLLKNPAVIEFDDMDMDWIAHGVMKRALTAEFITDRILGYSKTATVRTRTIFLGSGNNVGPKDDMRRRVATINLDPKCATPTTMEYKDSPVERIRKNRGLFVAAVLTIIQAWIAEGKPREKVNSIATYGAWSDYCRFPLLWLGLPDPATSLLEQVKQDPDGDPLVDLLHAWKSAFGGTATTVRKAIQTAVSGQRDLDEAIRDCLGEDRSQPNPSKLGWFLKKSAGRIVKGMRFIEAAADGRKAWKIVVVDEEALSQSLSARDSSSDGLY